jgi:hypothetical protein
MKTYNYYFLILTFSFILGGNSFAQNGIPRNTNTGFYIKSSNLISNLKSLNSVLTNNGYNAIDDNLFSISIGISSRREDSRNFGTATISYYETNSLIEASTSKTAELEFIELGVQAHRILSNSTNWLAYPYIGFGLSIGRLSLSQKTESLSFNESINDLSLNEKHEKVYTTPHPMAHANFGIGIDRRFALNQNTIFLGFNIGYKLTSRTNWGYSTSKSMGFSGFEFSITGRIEPKFK